MSIFSRLFTWGKSEANAAIDSIEDPVKMAEQGIRDLRKDLSKAMEGMAQVKAQLIRTKRDGQRYRDEAADYERKGEDLLGWSVEMGMKHLEVALNHPIKLIASRAFRTGPACRRSLSYRVATRQRRYGRSLSR